MLIFANGYYSYHYNYLITQLFNDLTTLYELMETGLPQTGG